MNKKNLVYLGVLAVLVILYAIVIRPHGMKREKLVPLFDVDTTAVVGIEITGSRDTVKLARDGQTWKMTYPVPFAVEAERVHDFMINVMLARRSDTELTDSPRKYDAYRIADSSAIRVRAFDGKTWSEARFGASSSVRVPGSKAVYRTKDDLSYYVSPSPSYWRDPEILSLEQEEIARIDVEYAHASYSLSRRDSTWTYSGMGQGFAMINTNVQLRKVLNALVNLRTRQFVDRGLNSLLPLFDQPALSLRITRTDGKTVLLRLVPQPDQGGRMLLRRDQETTTLFIMTTDFVDRFTKGPDHFRG